MLKFGTLAGQNGEAEHLNLSSFCLYVGTESSRMLESGFVFAGPYE